VTELCIEAAAGRVPVVAGAGSNSTAEAIDLAERPYPVRPAQNDAQKSPWRTTSEGN